jgi:ABC-2 type transport system ATP-binding protein
MRVDEYLRFCAGLHRVPPRAIGQAVDRIKRRCGLDRVGRRLLGKLSKGYQQRAGLAQALIHEPELVILDEPTDGLDPVQIREVRGLIRDLAPSAGVIVSSHALAEVQAVCNRVIILRDGEVLHQGALRDADTGSRLCVRLRRPPSAAELMALPPVAAATPIASGTLAETASTPARFRIELADGVSPDQLATALVGAGWGLLELVAERTDLERVFFQSIDAEARP